MRAILDIPETDRETTLTAWRAAFDVDANPRGFAHLAALLRVDRGDIYTGKLPYTCHFYGSVAKGGLHLIHGPEVSLGTALEILGIMAMHNRLARAAAPLKAPAFWLRPAPPDGAMRDLFDARPPLRPVLPAVQLSALAGLADAALRVMVTPLVRDGAIRAVQVPNGPDGFVLTEGFVNDAAVRRHFRH